MSERACVLCCQNTDDAVQLGEKITYEDTTAHLYCLLLTSNLMQNGDDDEGLVGFMPKDIKAEVQRTKKLCCFYCHEKGATIGCCARACRRSFHLPCALKNDCRLEFTNTFRSFCDLHHNINEPKNVHKPTDLCTVCYDDMGEYNPIRSIPLPCCNKNSWCHKICLQKYAQTSGYFLKCPLCKDEKLFRDWISQRGVFIPDRDARWELDDTGPDSFYGFEQHTERPSECVAKVCKCYRGRKYQVDSENSRHSLVYCHYCGSFGVHLGCLIGNDKEFLCDDCESVLKRTQENARSSSSDGSDRETFGTVNSWNSVDRQRSTQNQSMNTSNGRRTLIRRSYIQRDIVNIKSDSEDRNGSQSTVTKNLVSQFKLRDFTIRLRRLTPKDFNFQSQGSECQTASTSMNATLDSTSKWSGVSSDEQDIRPTCSSKSMVIKDSDSGEDEYLTAQSSSSRYSYSKGSQMDINDNSRDMPTSNITVKKPSELFTKTLTNGLHMRQLSSSEEDKIRPTGVSIRNMLCLDSSDDQTFGKENEAPAKSVAVVHPFARSESSSDDNIRPAKIRPRPRQRFSSSEETSDDILKPFVMPENRTFKIKEVGTRIDLNPSTASLDNQPQKSPKKRKRRTVLSYFRDTSSSEDETGEQKPKRKSPKTAKQRSSTTMERPPNQSTIMHFFQRQINQSS